MNKVFDLPNTSKPVKGNGYWYYSGKEGQIVASTEKKTTSAVALLKEVYRLKAENKKVVEVMDGVFRIIDWLPINGQLFAKIDTPQWFADFILGEGASLLKPDLTQKLVGGRIVGDGVLIPILSCEFFTPDGGGSIWLRSQIEGRKPFEVKVEYLTEEGYYLFEPNNDRLSQDFFRNSCDRNDKSLLSQFENKLLSAKK